MSWQPQTSVAYFQEITVYKWCTKLTDPRGIPASRTTDCTPANRLRAEYTPNAVQKDLCENLCVPALCDEDICRLDVAMNNSLTVRRIERVSNLNAAIEQPLQLQWTAED
jgi:hypothetical protein